MKQSGVIGNCNRNATKMAAQVRLVKLVSPVSRMGFQAMGEDADKRLWRIQQEADQQGEKKKKLAAKGAASGSNVVPLKAKV